MRPLTEGQTGAFTVKEFAEFGWGRILHLGNTFTLTLNETSLLDADLTVHAVGLGGDDGDKDVKRADRPLFLPEFRPLRTRFQHGLNWGDAKDRETRQQTETWFYDACGSAEPARHWRRLCVALLDGWEGFNALLAKPVAVIPPPRRCCAADNESAPQVSLAWRRAARCQARGHRCRQRCLPPSRPTRAVRCARAMGLLWGLALVVALARHEVPAGRRPGRGG